MGLDTTHNAWHGPYSSFAAFRKFIAKQIDIDLESMEGFGGNKSWKGIKDPLIYFLNHSDCDGHITPRRCKLIAERLREIAATLPKEQANDAWLYSKIIQFANGAEEAASKNENLIFK